MHRHLKLLLKAIIIVFVGIFFWFQNNYLVKTFFEYKSPKIPIEFNNFSILQISDLHNKQFGKDQERIIKKTKELNPDIIVITGDLIDKRNTNLDNIHNCLTYLQQAIEIAPIYFVSGNHECSSNVYSYLEKEMVRMGVVILNDKKEQIYRSGAKINITGLNDVTFYRGNTNAMKQKLSKMLQDELDTFNIVISHRPELLEIYEFAKADLVFTGHAHGGQFILPFVGGVININKTKLTKKMTQGIHKLKNTSMVVSRGLGNSLIPIRFMNYPELVYLKLKSSN